MHSVLPSLMHKPKERVPMPLQTAAICVHIVQKEGNIVRRVEVCDVNS